jgi:hypothetical protein
MIGSAETMRWDMDRVAATLRQQRLRLPGFDCSELTKFCEVCDAQLPLLDENARRFQASEIPRKGLRGHSQPGSKQRLAIGQIDRDCVFGFTNGRQNPIFKPFECCFCAQADQLPQHDALSERQIVNDVLPESSIGAEQPPDDDGWNA